MRIADASILVTGAAGDLGQAIVRDLQRRGCTQLVAADVNQTRLEALYGDALCTLSFDATDPKQCKDVLSAQMAQTGPFHGLVHAAGILASAPVVNLLADEHAMLSAAENWKRAIDINLSSTFYVGQVVARAMVKARIKGVFINFSSVSARGNPGQAAYSASKAGVEVLTKVMAKELGGFGIRAVAIAPGYVDTESTRQAVSVSTLQNIENTIPLRKLGQTQSIIDGVAFAIENEYLTGTVLTIDGGLRG